MHRAMRLDSLVYPLRTYCIERWTNILTQECSKPATLKLLIYNGFWFYPLFTTKINKVSRIYKSYDQFMNLKSQDCVIGMLNLYIYSRTPPGVVNSG